ncbi:hypothetical protein TcWFU_003702 [Taenia crassiceps]|uniref:Uncharacterized protein n=1 Tax=Taenia crassiceps TaxID=6207 RepID=A0ABR4Q1Y9_9CEST
MSVGNANWRELLCISDDIDNAEAVEEAERTEIFDTHQSAWMDDSHSLCRLTAVAGGASFFMLVYTRLHLLATYPTLRLPSIRHSRIRFVWRVKQDFPPSPVTPPKIVPFAFNSSLSLSSSPSSFFPSSCSSSSSSTAAAAAAAAAAAVAVAANADVVGAGDDYAGEEEEGEEGRRKLTHLVLLCVIITRLLSRSYSPSLGYTLHSTPLHPPHMRTAQPTQLNLLQRKTQFPLPPPSPPSPRREEE